MTDTAPPPTVLSRIAEPLLRLQHALIDLIRSKPQSMSASMELGEILAHARVRTDISDHLSTLFVAACASQPQLMVELGVRGGESTFVLERVARLCGSRLVSVDIEDCSSVCSDPQWLFIKSDDITFAREFPNWCKTRKLPSSIDLLFIDTSHIFKHTVQEIEHWFPLLAPRATVLFHDTNQRKIYTRKDGSIGIGWNNNRGVMAAIEQYFGKSFNERCDFVELLDNWLIKHDSLCNGFTVLTRLPKRPPPS